MAILLGADIDQTFTSLDEGKTPAPGDVFYASGNKVYKFVQYKEGAAATDGVAGEVCYYYTLDGYKLNQVTSDLSDSVEVGAGVLVTGMSDDEYGWIQIKGAATLSIALTAGADGDPLTPTGSADGTLDVSGAVTDHVCAIAGDISDQEIICDFPF
jgi:hypothetical protein